MASVLCAYAVSVYGADDPERTARIPSLLFGIATIPALFVVARRWVGELAGLVASLSLALSTFHVWYSQEASAYAIAFFFGVLSLGAYHRVVETNSRNAWRRWAVVTFFLVYSHFYRALFVLASQFCLFAWLVVRGRIEWTLGIQAAILLVYIAAAFITLTSTTLSISFW